VGVGGGRGDACKVRIRGRRGGGGGGGWIQVSRRERKEHGRRLYQQLLLASDFGFCMCVISHSVTHRLYGLLLLVYPSARLHRKRFVILQVAIN